jgi:hypothetical protein
MLRKESRQNSIPVRATNRTVLAVKPQPLNGFFIISGFISGFTTVTFTSKIQVNDEIKVKKVNIIGRHSKRLLPIRL